MRARAAKVQAGRCQVGQRSQLSNSHLGQGDLRAEGHPTTFALWFV